MTPLEHTTRVAVLGTLAEFHREPIPYDMEALVQLVTEVRPDFLCLDMSQEQWRERDFLSLPPEYREALLPLAERTDIVVVPVGDATSSEMPTAPGWRGVVIGWLRKGLAFVQRTAPGPDAINHGLRHDLANLLYHLIVMLSGRDVSQRRETHVEHLTDKIVEVSHRDPGTRVLVVTNVQYCHHIRPGLRKHADIEVVKYMQL